MSAPNQPELSPQSSLALKDDGIAYLSHIVQAGDDFDRAAQDVFALLQAAQAQHPGTARHLFIKIEGHKGERGGYDADFFEFQQEFMLGAMGRYFTRIVMPLTGDLMNPEPQDNNMGDGLQVNNPSE